MTVISCKEHIKDGMFSLPFEGGLHWGMTVRAAGDMRYRIAETNVRRIDTLRRIAMSGSPSANSPVADVRVTECEAYRGVAPDMRCLGQKCIEANHAPLLITQPELTHSQTVIAAKRFEDAFMRCADGIVTANRRLLLVVTVADCVPIFLFDRGTGTFGIVHSGWRGTGIAARAVALMKSSYGTRPQDVIAVIGPHIQSMCYTVDKERAQLFQDAYGADCVEAADGEYHLSLLRANLAVLHRAGVMDENITAASDCTCCNEEYGSFRRETGGMVRYTALAGRHSPTIGAPFTVQAAFCGYLYGE